MIRNIREKVEQYLSRLYGCTVDDLHRTGTSITSASRAAGIRVVAYSDATLVVTRKDLISAMARLIRGRTRDEIFEMPFVYGQTIHYVPDMLLDVPVPKDLGASELLIGNGMRRLESLEGFSNSLCFDADGHPSADAACVVRNRDGAVVGAAAATASPLGLMWKMGIDVLPEYRKNGVATFLVSKLTGKLTDRGILPFYSASSTNLASQMVAARAGLTPAWTDSFGTVGNDAYPYKQFSSELVSMLDSLRNR